jgi:hypothetical protein
MYDPPGSNAGNQWIEVTNSGASPVNLAQYRLAEGGTNHKLMIMAGTTTLPGDTSAIIATHTDSFLSLFPLYSGILFKSAFSLPSKSSGSIALKDAAQSTIDTVTYDPSAGAAGDGNSLHRSDGSLVVGAPNPGSTAATKPIIAVPKNTGTIARTGAAKSSAAKTSSAKPINKKSNQNLSAAPLLSQLALPEGPVAWALGGLGVAILSACGLWYLRLQTRNISEADGYKIES